MRHPVEGHWEVTEARRQRLEVGEVPAVYHPEHLRQSARRARGCLDVEALCGLVDGQLRRISLRRWLSVWQHVRLHGCRECQKEVAMITAVVRPTAELRSADQWRQRSTYLLLRSTALAAGMLLLAGCSGPQSALEPAGRGAERIADLFWVMTAGSVVVWLAVIALALYATRVPPEAHSRRRTNLLIIGGGTVIPTVVLAALLVYGLALMPDLLAPAPEGSLRIAVSGEQWWWRVRYLRPDGEAVELANEIRLPVGEPVEFTLQSPDVIHSFWIPGLGGKMDMIPGRTTRLTLAPTRTGIFRGACAEYCGTSHALMAFDVVVLEKEDFDRWLAHQAGPAQEPAEPSAVHGQELFLANGCGACHTIRGIAANGVVGPDLTHVGSRLSLGAGFLPNEPEAFLRWIARTEEVKPGVHMPAFGMLPAEDLQALAVYLDGLQ